MRDGAMLIKGHMAQAVEVIAFFANENRVIRHPVNDRVEKIENLDAIGLFRDAFPVARPIGFRFVLNQGEFLWLHRRVHFAHEGHGIGRDGGVLMFVERTEKGKAGKKFT